MGSLLKLNRRSNFLYCVKYVHNYSLFSGFFGSFLSLASFLSAELSFERQVIDDKISIGYGLAIGDVDGDKKPDILLADKSQAAWYRNDWKDL